MNQKYHYLFIILIFNFFFISFNLDLFAQNEQLYIVDLKKNKIFLNELDDYILVIYHYINCKDCFKDIQKKIKEYNFDSNKVICVIRPPESNNLSKRIYLNEAKERFKVKNYYFDDHSIPDHGSSFSNEGIVGYYKINKTPAILRISNNKTKYFSYEKLYNKDGYLNEEIIKEIFK